MEPNPVGRVIVTFVFVAVSFPKFSTFAVISIPLSPLLAVEFVVVNVVYKNGPPEIVTKSICVEFDVGFPEELVNVIVIVSVPSVWPDGLVVPVTFNWIDVPFSTKNVGSVFAKVLFTYNLELKTPADAVNVRL